MLLYYNQSKQKELRYHAPQTPLHPHTSDRRPQFTFQLQAAARKPVPELFPAERISGDAVEEDGGFCVGECVRIP